MGCLHVTEDADLGLRLARCGFEVDVIPSTTREEPNCVLGGWMRQRARWIKGWIQTAIVHLRSPRRLYDELGPARFFVVVLLFLTMVVSSLVHPLFFALMLWAIISRHVMPETADVWPSLLFGLNAVVFAAGYGASMLAGLKGIRLRRLRGFARSVVSMPAYWLIISAGGALAVWQFFSNRFHWNKTQHGHNPFRAGNDPSLF